MAAFRYSPSALQKLESFLKNRGYLIRYEKGNFHAGYCLVEEKKVIIVNKYFETEARINSLIEILSSIQFDESDLSDEEKSFYYQLKSVKSHS